MTRAQFRTLAKAFVDFFGRTHLATDADWDAHVNDFLPLFTERTFTLYTHASPVGSWAYGTPPVYDLTDIGFWATGGGGLKRRVFWPVSVSVAGRPLRNALGRPGPISQEQMVALTPDLATAVAPANVRHWSRVGPRSIRLFPTPNAAGSGTVEGYYLHPVLATDGDSLELPDQYERVAAAYVAAEALRTRSMGELYESMERMSQGAGVEMQRMEAEASRVCQGLIGRVVAPLAPEPRRGRE